MKAKQKLTPWFPVSVKPVRAGLYLIRTHPKWPVQTPYSYWNGRRFNWVSNDRERAYRWRKDPGAGEFVIEWRGLAEQPK